MMRWRHVSIILILSAYTTSLTNATKSDKCVLIEKVLLEFASHFFFINPLFLHQTLVATAFASFLQGLLLFRISEESDFERGVL